MLAKRLFFPWYQNEFIWGLTSFKTELKSYMDYGSDLVDRILKCRMADTSSDLTFVDRLLHISEENDDFSLDDVKAETTTLLYGVSVWCFISERNNTNVFISILEILYSLATMTPSRHPTPPPSPSPSPS